MSHLVLNQTSQFWQEKENKTTKMAMSTGPSMTEELLITMKDKSFHTCVSNLTKNHAVNMKKFNRDCLPKETWISTKRFITGTNRIVPSAMFDLFGEYSSQNGSIVQDNMIGCAYDNFCLLEDVFCVALTQRKTTLHQ